jgi:hypothetical protein
MRKALAVAFCLAAACGGGDSPVSPTPVTCTYAVPTATLDVPSAGQTFVLKVDTGSACAWTATPSAPWITVVPSSGSGGADVTVTVAANDATAERTAQIAIGGQTVPVRQAARATTTPCAYALVSSSSTFGPEGGKGHVSVETAAGCPWNASSSASWLALRVASGSGPGDVEYEVAVHDGTTQREARIVVGEASFTVKQDPPVIGACTYAVDPTSTQLHWHGSPGDGMDVHLTTAGQCSWTAASGASWIELLTAGSGTGPATMRIRVGAYTSETTRSAPLMIRWPTPTAGQNVFITQEGCYYAISVHTDNVPAAGGRRRVSVYGDPVSVTCMIGCPWNVVTSTSWIHIAGSTSRAGDDDVFYDVDANVTGATRTGTLTIGGLVLTVVQGA